MTRSALDTPMMRQFLEIKARHPDALVFYRMGDFYELFLRDAEVAAPLLDVALTTRDRHRPDPVPMCGVPVHAADGYVKRLTELGHKVAICEQVEDPRSTGGRRLVRREVVEVVTPGLVGDLEGIEAGREVGLAAIAPSADGAVGLAVLDASTGGFRATTIEAGEGPGAPAPALVEELRRVDPREILLPDAAPEGLRGTLAAALPEAALTAAAEASFDPAAAPARPDGFDPESRDPRHRAAAAVLAYLAANQPFALEQVARLRSYRLCDSMVIDAATRTHLELFRSMEDGSRRATLIGRLDRTRTPPGARRLARWIAYPLLDPDAVGARQDAVAWLADRDRPRARLREALRAVRDLERLLARAARPTAGPRDLVALRRSLEALPEVAAALDADDEVLLPEGREPRPRELPVPEPVTGAAKLIAEALVDDPPVVHRGSRGATETGYVRDRFDSELDALRERARTGRETIAGLEARERERTGIASLKVRFHPVHGYAIEVTRANAGRVPGDYERKQTLANAERFTTPGLREAEQSVLGARDRAAALEREVFESLRRAVLAHAPAVREAAEAVAGLDALASLAEVARGGGWVRPVVDTSAVLRIEGGRHPVVEEVQAATGADGFVPNDTDLDPSKVQLLLLTGPNMSGKSTYLRQVALCVLLGQMGSFVPAQAARIGCVDRLFTRVGASDRLARGESTFLVEMRETAEILSQASPRSLVILDEIGRGTSTFDGLSIAWAVAEYLHDTPGLRPRTLFATHYHELTELARRKARVRNAHFEAREWGDRVIFLRRLVPGGASRSYGIQVAGLAGLPQPVIARAREVLRELETERDACGAPAAAPQLGLFEAGPADPPAAAPPSPPPPEAEVIERLRALDPDRTTPMEALTALSELVAALRRGTAQ